MTELSVLGAGHVGAVTAACFAAVGHRVRVHDIDDRRIEELRAGRPGFVEAGLENLIKQGIRDGTLSFHGKPRDALRRARLAFICVGTPNDNGRVDLGALETAVQTVARHADADVVVVNRSTVPVRTHLHLQKIIEERRGGDLALAVNPEFLAEGTAVRDFLAPDRVLIGATDEQIGSRVLDAYEPILARRLPPGLPKEVYARAASGPRRVPTLVVDPASVELAKYAANAFLAVKISFINEIARFAEELGADVTAVSRAIGLDRRIGPQFLRAGLGWGGSCFPKDISTLQGIARRNGLPAQILAAANGVNEEQRMWVVRQLERRLGDLEGRVVTLLGLAFKPHTDDLRHAPALEIADELKGAGAVVRAFDPAVVDLPPESGIEPSPDVRTAAKEADALVLVTDWPDFAELDLAELRRVTRGALLIDGRNLFDPEAARAAGFEYVGVGR